MAISKVIYGGKTLIDLTADTVTAEKVLNGYTAHGADGEKITGTCDYDANTQDATAADAEILAGKIAYVKGTKKTGTMKNNGAVTGTISTKDEQYTVPQGYHDGSGKVSISATEQEKIKPENIRDGVGILYVTVRKAEIRKKPNPKAAHGGLVIGNVHLPRLGHHHSDIPLKLLGGKVDCRCGRNLVDRKHNCFSNLFV